MKKEGMNMQGRKALLWKSGVLALVLSLYAGLLGEAIAAGEAPKTIKLGCSMALTGIFGAGGKWVKQGYELGIKRINDAGGVYIEQFKKKIPL
jgi:ABC-type branched-subunit amino acid transport system substrate-binding protein